jgi:amino acid adenylation domain-containing protein
MDHSMAAQNSEEVFVLPCSFAQQRLWLVSQISADSPFYNIHASIRIDSRLERSAMEKATNDLLARHESLRTAIAWEEAHPVQRIAACLTIPVTFDDLGEVSPEEATHRTLALSQAEATRPFDLAMWPLIRVRLVRLPQLRTVLMVTIHHIIADAWSMGIIFREIWELYCAAIERRPPNLVELPIQYADFAVWQRDRLKGEKLERLLAYWRRKLDDLPTLELPTDFPRPAVASHNGRTYAFRFSESLSSGVLALGRSAGVTPYMTLLAVFTELLHRYTGQTDIVVGAPVAGRERAELENVVGFFVNSLVLRLDRSGDPSFLALLERVRAATVEALAHQELPFERLVEEIRPGRNLSHNPLFQVTFQFLATPAGTASRSDVLLDVQRGSANFDLGVDLWLNGDRIEGRIDYATDLYGADTIERMLGHFICLAEQAVALPEASARAFDMLTAGERAIILDVWRGSTSSYPRDKTIHELFAEQTAKAPQRTAVVAEDGMLTYGELSELSQRAAHALAAKGVRRGDRVGLELPRGLMQVVGMLGILRVGAAYVALDPELPSMRRALLVADGRLRAILGSRPDGDVVGPELIDIADAASEAADAPLRAEGSANDLAYVAYTSGSTGEPKGVMACHRGVVRLVRDSDIGSFGPSDSMMAYAPLPFDASTLEIWAMLLNGGRVVMPGPRPLGPEELAEFLDRHAVTCAWLTAGLFHQVSAVRPDSLARVRQLYAGGDVIRSSAVKRVLDLGGTVINGYGPTENTTFTCCHRITAPCDPGWSVPIGRPIANTYVYILDADGRPVPAGVPGELVTGGDGLALGYLGRPDLTAEHFVADPIEPARGRVYHTGDFARWRGDGTIEFLGRRDRQVKIRGFRVEPQELEFHLAQHPEVAQAAVNVCLDEAREKRLVAYVVSRGGTCAPDQIRRFIAGHVPAHLMPSAIVPLDSLPLKSNGKVDFAALIDPEDALSEPGGIEPDGEIEQLVTEVFKDVLRVSAVAADRNFFDDYGGHSLLAMQAITRLRATLQIKLPLQAIFEAPTVRDLALLIEDQLLSEITAQAAAE